VNCDSELKNMAFYVIVWSVVGLTFFNHVPDNSQIEVKDQVNLFSDEQCGEQTILQGKVHNPDTEASKVRRGEFPWFVQNVFLI
jgi:hypothetical protein